MNKDQTKNLFSQKLSAAHVAAEQHQAGQPTDQSTPLTNATMNHSNADASVNSAEAGIRGCVNAGATAANSTGVNSFCSIHPSIHPSVSQMSCHIHVNANASVRT